MDRNKMHEHGQDNHVLNPIINHNSIAKRIDIPLINKHDSNDYVDDYSQYIVLYKESYMIIKINIHSSLESMYFYEINLCPLVKYVGVYVIFIVFLYDHDSICEEYVVIYDDHDSFYLQSYMILIKDIVFCFKSLFNGSFGYPFRPVYWVENHANVSNNNPFLYTIIN